MRYLLLLLLCGLLGKATCRPQAVLQEYKDAEEAEYEEESPDDSPRDDSAAVNERANIKEEDDVMEPHHNRNYFFKHHAADRSPEEQTTKENTNDDLSECKSARRIVGPDEDAAENDQDQPVTNRRYDRHNEHNNPKNQFIQALVNRKENGILRNFQLLKRKDDAVQEENNDILYENGSNQDHVSKYDKSKRNDDTAESTGQLNYYNHYYNKPQTENKESEDDPYEEIVSDDANRDRRDTNDPDETNDGSSHDTKEKKEFDNYENEAEQAIVQRYVKKLNKKEVENLMSVLSDDKKAILEQIIGSDGNNQGISLSKREITKKAEAVEENNFIDSVQSDSNKVSGPLINFNGITDKNSDPTGMTPAIEETESSTKNCENKLNKRSNEEAISEKSENGAVTTSSTESVTAKSENKREVNANEFSNDGSLVDNLKINEPQESSFIGSQDELYASSQDEDLSVLMDDDAQLHYTDYRNPQKRDLMQENNQNIAEPMKSLQESFSDTNNYDNSGYIGDLNMMPLIRVKRKNNEHAVKKRAAAILPETKVAYIPENEDEDNDEGNEIYDNGFFDRTASFARSNKRIDKVSDSRPSANKLNTDGKQSVFKRSSVEGGHADGFARDTMSIGSDTDSVMSGEEGVNENLMYSGGCRNKRAAEEITKLEPVNEIIKVNMHQNASRSSLMDDTSRPEVFGVIFNSNDDFGSSSKTYDGELGRYKRIRRLKQRSALKNSTSNIVV